MKKLALIAVLAAAFVLFPLDAANGGLQHTITFEKVVVGQGGGDTFAIEIDCTETGTSIRELEPGIPETEFFSTNLQTCTITEPDTQGADVTFECTDATGDAECDAGNVVDFIQDGSASATVTITNTFVQATTTTAPSTTTTQPAAAPAAAVVVATPAFTG
jgi:hypothetical protein